MTTKTIINCPNCAHEFCMDCGIIMLETVKDKILTCTIKGLECCQCKWKTDCEPYVVYRSLKIPFVIVKNPVSVAPNYEATSEGEREK